MKPRVVVIGAGLGGIAAVIELKRRGHDDIVVLEKATDIGGVWRENTYPGAACDVPSPFYSYSYEPNPRWPHRYSRQPAILDYIHHVAQKYDVVRHVRLGTEVTGAAYDEATGQWTVHVSDGGPLTADVVVSAVGQLSRPSAPSIEGAETFDGPVFHSATWDHDVDLAGRRVAVIGTGASAIQFVPAIQPEVGHMDVFQRTPPYLMPRKDRAFGPRVHRAFERSPLALLVERGRWYALAESLSVAWVHSKVLSKVFELRSRMHMRRQTKARPGLFERVWPRYEIGCKRVLFADDYLPALTQPNVDLVTTGIEQITPTGVVTTDGVEHPADVLIWGTGFKATEFLAPMRITGAGDRDLHETWSEGARAYYGLTVPHFPGLVIMYGPNTNTGGGSIIYFLETQARYLGDYVDHLAGLGRPLDLRPEVEESFDTEIQGRLSDSVWTRCTSWYRQADGRITTNWPLLGIDYRRRARFDPADYAVCTTTRPVVASR